MSTPHKPKKLYTRAGIERLFCVSRHTVNGWIDDDLQAIQVRPPKNGRRGSDYMIDSDDVRKYLAAKKAERTARRV